MTIIRHWSDLTKEEKNTEIQKLEDGLSATQIAAALVDVGIIGQTRNAVIGHIHRNMNREVYLPTSNQTKAKSKFKSPKVERKGGVKRIPKRAPKPRIPTGRKKPDRHAPAPLETFPNSVMLVDLTPTTCRFPLWGSDDPPELGRFCGENCDVTESYCDFHRRVTESSHQEEKENTWLK